MDEVQPGCPEPSGVAWRSLCTRCACVLVPAPHPAVSDCGNALNHQQELWLGVPKGTAGVRRGDIG